MKTKTLPTLTPLSLLLTLTTLFLLLTLTLPPTPLRAQTLTLTLDITPLPTVPSIQTTLQSALNDANISEVHVTGTFTGATSDLVITIPPNKKVIWDAKYSGESHILGLIYVIGAGEIEITENAEIVNTLSDPPLPQSESQPALHVTHCSFTMNGGSLQAREAPALRLTNTIGVINDGELVNASSHPLDSSQYTVVANSSALSVHGGTIRNNAVADNAIALTRSTIYVTGGTIQRQGINRGGSTDTSTGYYNALTFRDLFNSTFNNNLFGLDRPTFGGYTYNAATPHDSTIIATFPEGLTITSVTASPAAALHSFRGNIVTFAGTYDLSYITLAVTGTVADGLIPVAFTTTSFNINIDSPPQIYVNGVEVTEPTVARIRAAIDTELVDENTSEARVTGTFAGANSVLYIQIPEGKKIVWGAKYEGSSNGGLINISYGEIEITENARIVNNQTVAGAGSQIANALLVDNGKLTMNGGSLEARTSPALRLENNTIAVINGGELVNNSAQQYTVNVARSVLSVHGGTIKNNSLPTNAITLSNSSIYVTGGNIQNHGIRRDNSPSDTSTGYYTGEHYSLFNTFSGTNLFQLGLRNLSTPYNPTTPTTAVTVTFHGAGLTVTDMQVSHADALYTLEGNAVIFAGDYNITDITISVTGTVADGRIPVQFTTDPFGVHVSDPTPRILVNGVAVTELSVENIKAAIDTALADEEVSEVRVTGRFAEADSQLSIQIPEGKKVVWGAKYEGNPTGILVNISQLLGQGAGEFELVENAEIVNKSGGSGSTPVAVHVSNGVKFTMNGGYLEAQNASALQFHNAIGIINDGELKNQSTQQYTVMIGDGSALSIHGGTIRNGSSATRYINANSSSIYVTGSNIQGGSAINRVSNSTGYYTGVHGILFNATFTNNTNLFRLDQPDRDGYFYSAETPHEGTVTVTFPDVLTIDTLEVSEAEARYTQEGNAVIFAGNYNITDITISITGTVADGLIPVQFTTAPFGVHVSAGDDCPHEIDMEKNCIACLACGEVLFERTCTKDEPCMWHGSVPTGVVDVRGLWWVMVVCGLVAVVALAFFVGCRRRADFM
ncbi:MAG: hypothetical protein FWG87_13185 [Defluviitaleaceae bacterium]|nr:hypothetical protein [Defluviitaleaceae bacterium]